MNPRTLSLAALTVLDVPPAQQVHCAAEAGFSHVGLRLVPATASEPHYDMIGHTPMVRDTLSALQQTGVKVSDVEILRLTPEMRASDFEVVFETAARFGAGQVLVAGNDADFSRAADNLAQLAELGAGFGLTMNVEPMPWTAVRNIADARRLILAAGREDLAILIDAIHFDRADESLASLGAIPRSMLKYVQLCDAPAERPLDEETLIYQARAARMIPGSGGLDLHGLLAALPSDLPVSVEVPLAGADGKRPAHERAKLLYDAARALV